MTQHHGKPCPEDRDLPCPVCQRRIDQAEADRYAPTGYDHGLSDREADRMEQALQGWGDDL